MEQQSGPVTVEEQYARAVFAKRLGSGDGPSPTDVLMAMAREGNLGPLLSRLRVEHDEARGQQARALRHQQQLQDAIKAAAAAYKRAQRPGSPRHAERDQIARDLQALHDQAEHDAQLDHLALLERMPTLPEAAVALSCWAEIEATRCIAREVKPHPLMLMELKAKALRDTRPGPSLFYARLWQQEQRRKRALAAAARGTSLTPQAVRSIAGGVLRAWVDPNCRSCGGRGHKLGFGLAEIACRACGGTGRAGDALHALGQTQEQREFARHLLAEMERMFDATHRRMRHYLRGRNLRG